MKYNDNKETSDNLERTYDMAFESVYKMICENVKNDQLDRDFNLPQENNESVHWAPGAMDGVYIYHLAHSAADKETLSRMGKAIDEASEGNFEQAEQSFFELTKASGAISLVDDIQRYIIDNKDELDLDNLFSFAITVVTESAHAECVKVGLEILELFDTSQQKIRDVIANLALYDEFTIFALWCMRHWNDGNDKVFKTAKEVHGWGRIHAIEIIEPDTLEIKQWLLTEGVYNDVMPAYSALTCWNKSDAESILFAKPTPAEYKGLADLIYGLLDEGPISGISTLDNREQILLRFLEIARDYDLTAEEYDVIHTIKRWADNDKDNKMLAVAEKAREVLESSR